MSLTPTNKDSLVQRLTTIENRIDEIARKNFTTFTVTDASGVQMMSVLPGNAGRRQLSFKDASGDVLIQNDVNGAGWGFSHPQPANTSVSQTNYLGNQNATTSDATVWSVFMPVLTQKVHGYGFMCIVDPTTSRFGTFTVKWAPLGTATYTTMNTTTITGQNIAVLQEFDYTWPSNMYNQIVEVSFWSFTSTTGANCFSSYVPVGVAERHS